MNSEQVIAEVIAALKEYQTKLGYDDADAVTPKVKPHGGLKGFQSDLTPTIVHRVARKLGHPLPEGVATINIFYSADGKEKLSVEEASERFLAHYCPKGAPNERTDREEKDHSQPPPGGPKNVGAYAGTGSVPNGPSSPVDLGD